MYVPLSDSLKFSRFIVEMKLDGRVGFSLINTKDSTAAVTTSIASIVSRLNSLSFPAW